MSKSAPSQSVRLIRPVDLPQRLPTDAKATSAWLFDPKKSFRWEFLAAPFLRINFNNDKTLASQRFYPLG
jgi:hypothetical protein